MSIIGSVSQWIHEAKSGDEIALGELHGRYWPKLVELATKKMRGAVLRDRDAEDIAQVSFVAVLRAIRAGKTPQLENRHQFLAFLTHVIACKTINEMKHANAVKRGGGEVASLPAVEQLVLGQAAPTPLEQAIMKDCYAEFVSSLPDQLIGIAELHLAGFSNREIANEFNCVERTVERKLALIRQHWSTLADHAIF